jgi:hypothetical protein
MEALEDRTLLSSDLVDPGALGPLAVTTQEYTLGDSAFTPNSLGLNPIELTGEVKAPTTLTGQMPLIILLHGQHDTVFQGGMSFSRVWPPTGGQASLPSYHGYDALGDVLASNGYIVVSLSANGINARDNFGDLGLQARADLIQRHLDIWHDLNADGVVHTRDQHDHFADGQMPFGTRFVGHVDLHDVGLMGHSRGGEGVVKAYLDNQSLGSPYGIKAVFALAPVDNANETITNVPFAVLLPYNDGDVSSLEGLHYFDDSRYNFSGDTAAKYTIEVMGANHNFFNTVWSPDGGFPGGTDDGNPGPPTRLLPALQRSAGVTYMSAFFRTYLGPTQQFLSVLDGDLPPPPSAVVSADRIHTSYLPPDNPAQRRDINRLNDPSNITTNTLGGNVTFGNFNNFGIVPSNPIPGARVVPYPDHGNELNVRWFGTALHFFQNEIPLGANDESGYSDLQIRVGVDHADPLNQGDQDFVVQLTDGSGLTRGVAVAGFAPDGVGALFKPPTPADNPHTVLNTVRIPLRAFASAGIELSDIRSVRLTFNQRFSGGLFLSDMAFTADVLGVQMSAANNNLLVQNDPQDSSSFQVVNATTSAVLAEYLISTFKSIAVLGGSNDETLTVSYQFGGPLPAGGLDYRFGSRTDTLIVNDQTASIGTTWTLTGTSVQRGAAAPITFNAGGINFVTLDGSTHNNIWNILDTEFGSTTTVNTGAGDDIVNVMRTSGPTTVNGGGTGNARVNVGNANSLAGIRDRLTLNNPSGWQVNVNDGADNADHPDVRLSAAALTGLIDPGSPVPGPPINFGPNSIKQLTITVGNGKNTYTVVNTQAVSFAGGNLTILNTGNGNDTVNVRATAATAPLIVNGGGNEADIVNVGNATGLAGLHAPLTLNNNPSYWQVNINDSADTANHPNVRLSASTLTGLTDPAAPINFGPDSLHGLTVNGGSGTDTWTVVNTQRVSSGRNTTTLNTGTSTNTVNVQATARTAPLVVNCGAPDVFYLGQVDPTTGLGTVQNIQDAVTILNAIPGSTGLANVTVNDYNDTTAHNVNITTAGITGLTAPLNLSAASVAVLDIGGPIHTGGSTWTISGTPASEVMQLAAPGPDTVTVQATSAGTPSVPTTTGIASPTIIVGQVDPTTGRGTLQGIQGRLLILNSYLAQFSGPANNFSPATVQQVNDANDPNPQVVTISSDGISRQSAPAAPINQIPGPTGISSIGTLTYLGGVSSTGNAYTITGTPVTTTLTVSAPGSDTVNVQATAAGTTTIIQGGSGSHQTFNVGSAAHTLDPIQGPVTVTGGTGGSTTLNILDDGSTTQHTYTQTSTTFSRSGAATITFFNITTLNPLKGPRAGSPPAAQDLALTDTVQVGDLATLSGQLVDDNPDAQLQLEVDWGEGSDPDVIQPGLDPFSLQHSYAQAGTYTVRAIWTDLATGESNSRDLTIQVLDA